LVYGPVSCGLLYVDRELAPSVYAVTQALHVPLNYTFKKGIGPIEWGIRGGYYLELVSHSLKGTDRGGQEAKSHQQSSKK